MALSSSLSVGSVVVWSTSAFYLNHSVTHVRWRCSPYGRWRSGVDEDVVLLKFLNICLHLVELFFEIFFPVLFAEGVKRPVVRLALVLQVQLLPLALEGGNQFLAFFLWHEHFLSVAFGLFLKLHFLHEVVFILDLVLNLRQVSRGLAVCLLFQIILVLVRGQFRSYNNKN